MARDGQKNSSACSQPAVRRAEPALPPSSTTWTPAREDAWTDHWAAEAGGTFTRALVAMVNLPDGSALRGPLRGRGRTIRCRQCYAGKLVAIPGGGAHSRRRCDNCGSVFILECAGGDWIIVQRRYPGQELASLSPGLTDAEVATLTELIDHRPRPPIRCRQCYAGHLVARGRTGRRRCTHCGSTFVRDQRTGDWLIVHRRYATTGRQRPIVNSSLTPINTNHTTHGCDGRGGGSGRPRAAGRAVACSENHSPGRPHSEGSPTPSLAASLSRERTPCPMPESLRCGRAPRLASAPPLLLPKGNPMRRVILSCIAALVVTGGCAFIKPTTLIELDPVNKTVRVLNTKDVDFTLESLTAEWTADGGSVQVSGLTISDKSSPVITANVEQMLAFAEQQRAANEGLIGALQQLTGWLGELRQTMGLITQMLRGSGVTVDTQWGGGSANLGTAPAD